MTAAGGPATWASVAYGSSVRATSARMGPLSSCGIDEAACSLGVAGRTRCWLNRCFLLRLLLISYGHYVYRLKHGQYRRIQWFIWCTPTLDSDSSFGSSLPLLRCYAYHWSLGVISLVFKHVILSTELIIVFLWGIGVSTVTVRVGFISISVINCSCLYFIFVR